MLSERQLEVVLSVVYEYIQSGESVGSRTVSKRYLTSHSAATIRNEMSDLEDMGYLTQPHASAGRVPTTRAYRLYVDTLLERRKQAHDWLGTAGDHRRDLENSLSRAADMLSRVTSYVGVGALAPVKDVQVERVDFFRLDSSHAMSVVMLNGGTVHHKVMEMPCDLSQDAMSDMANRISLLASGKTWGDFRGCLQAYVTDMLQSHAEACMVAIDGMDQMLASGTQRVYTGTMSQMLDLPDFQNLGRLHALISLLEEESGLSELVTSCSADGVMSVVIGEESSVPQMKDCSLVVASSQLGGSRAILGIIGPRRMNYERVISALEEALQSLQPQEE